VHISTVEPLFIEGVLTSARSYQRPDRDVAITVEFRDKQGNSTVCDAFWDGDNTWRVRFSPLFPGEFSFRVSCSDPTNDLHNRAGVVNVPTYDGDNPLYKHGPLKVSDNGRYLVHEDGTPFFWLADTAWNGVLKAQPTDWERYLALRRSQGFTAVQCVLTHWRAFQQDSAGEQAFFGTSDIRINPAFFRRLDTKVAAISRHGLVPALVVLWACTPKDPGYYLPQADAALLARYIVARYGQYRPVWLFGGDGAYLGEKAERWRELARSVLRSGHALTTMHPAGMQWVADRFAGESWYGFVGYQSGHGDLADTLRWISAGPPAQAWRRVPPRPIINLEPCYEEHLSYRSKQRFTAADIRKALYLSLLTTPTAGVTYGHHGIWSWASQREIPTDHPNSGEAPPWYEAVESPGAESVQHLAGFFRGLPWWKLQPGGDRFVLNADTDDMLRFVAVSHTPDEPGLVAYFSQGGSVRLQTGDLMSLPVRWYDPRQGVWHHRGHIDSVTREFRAPDDQDWLLVIGL